MSDRRRSPERERERVVYVLSMTPTTQPDKVTIMESSREQGDDGGH